MILKKNETSRPESNLKRNQRKDKITIRKMLHTHSRRQKMKRIAHCAEATRLSAFRTNNNTIKRLDFQFGLYFSYLFFSFFSPLVDCWRFVPVEFLHFYFEMTISLVDTVNKDKWRCQWWHCCGCGWMNKNKMKIMRRKKTETERNKK